MVVYIDAIITIIFYYIFIGMLFKADDALTFIISLAWIITNFWGGFLYARNIRTFRWPLVFMQLLCFLIFWEDSRLGVILFALGIIMNEIVVFFNGGMPVSLEAMKKMMPWLSRFEAIEYLINDGKRPLMPSETKFPLLADIIYFPGSGSISSIGDTFIDIGSIIIIFKVLFS